MSSWDRNRVGVIIFLQDATSFRVISGVIEALVEEFAIWSTIFFDIPPETHRRSCTRSCSSYFIIAISCGTRKAKDQQVLFEFVIKGFPYLKIINFFQNSDLVKVKILFSNRILYSQHYKMLGLFFKDQLETQLDFWKWNENQDLYVNIERSKKRDNLFYVQSDTVFFFGLNFKPVST